MKGYINHKNLKLRILDIIRNTGPSTKQEIAEKLGINITTMSSLINNLFKESKILVISGVDDSTGGRKPKLYKINEKFGYVIGIDIGGENIRVIVTDFSGSIISGLKDRTNGKSDSEKIIDKILDMMGSSIIKSKISKEKILGIGISISGIIDTESGYSLFCPNIEGFKELPLRKIMEEKTKRNVFIDDSVRCMAIAEERYGIARGFNNFIFISLGKGIGSGIFIDGKVYRGSMGLTGELGHITVSEDGPTCKCGNRGCLEAVASNDGIIKRTREGMKKGIVTSISSVINGNFDNLTIEIIAKAANDGDKFAYHIINRTGEYIGIAIATAINLFGSNLIVLGGGISGCGDILISAIKRTVKTRALDVISKRVKIVITQLGDNIAALGAATNFIDMLFDPHYEENILNRDIK